MAFLRLSLLLLFVLSCSAGDNVFVTMNETTEVFLGDSAQIHCHYHFPKDPRFYWIVWYVTYPSDSREYIYTSYRSEEVVYRDTGYWGRTNVTNQHEESVLTIHNVQLSDEREFFCQIYHLTYDNIKASTSLKVFAAPDAPEIKGVTTRITLSPTVNNDEPSEIASCETRNDFPRPNITWYRNGTPLVQTPGLVDMKITGSESHGLHTIQNTLFYKVDKKDVDASFTCEVIYRVPGSIRTNMSESINITVDYLDPAVVVPEESQVILIGEDVTASCNALSSLKTTTVWYKNGKQVGEGTTLHLKDVTFETTGEYLCVVTVDSPALMTSSSVHIIVHGGPQLVGAGQEVQLQEVTGEMVNLICVADGYPLPNITWSVSGSQTWNEVRRIAYGHTTLSVVSVKVTSDISAQCNASNDLGAETKTFSLKATSSSILSLLLLAIVISVLYFLHKKGKITFGNSKKEMNQETDTNDDIVIEMTDISEAMEHIHEEMGDIHEEMGDIHEEMGDIYEEMGDIHEEMGDIYEEMGDIHEEMGDIYEEMGGIYEEMGDIHEEMGDIYEEMGDIHEEMGDIHEEMGDISEEMGDIHEEMGDIHEEMGDIHEEMGDIYEEMGDISEEM